jgi:hypothetical protein
LESRFLLDIYWNESDRRKGQADRTCSESCFQPTSQDGEGITYGWRDLKREEVDKLVRSYKDGIKIIRKRNQRIESVVGDDYDDDDDTDETSAVPSGWRAQQSRTGWTTELGTRGALVVPYGVGQR